ncbi:uncharacterized protein L969DRAFT_97240 [Mixia osmundae IAM 14324]|uniref:Uncharacterized protein n=1 Tax=Mixia osmundae (strain CBS 9802 / IAM 14324 / JCM 22182 / KY 12970) TaxID=764103 RepID=G7DWA9_MIXOS|nr:uncharacterized protein L969DRAFT_97240 [Mixia osmundae IAM 14324]KEI36503.1 hypothetical protein L969DRAFT_97240 [Mixia osmundae IAM 14324]GAA94797.1 hypothetical protein E5Q_01451 [Mixia osmundae IAM 14324]
MISERGDVTGELSKRYETYTNYALSMISSRGVRFRLADGSWGRPSPLFSKLIQKFTVIKKKDFFDVSANYEYTVDFAILSGVSASFQSTSLVHKSEQVSHIILDWATRIQFSGAAGQERDAMSPFEQCCTVVYNYDIPVSFDGKQMWILSSPYKPKVSVDLVCGRDHALAFPFTAQCEDFVKDYESKFAYTDILIDHHVIKNVESASKESLIAMSITAPITVVSQGSARMGLSTQTFNDRVPSARLDKSLSSTSSCPFQLEVILDPSRRGGYVYYAGEDITGVIEISRKPGMSSGGGSNELPRARIDLHQAWESRCLFHQYALAEGKQRFVGTRSINVVPRHEWHRSISRSVLHEGPITLLAQNDPDDQRQQVPFHVTLPHRISSDQCNANSASFPVDRVKLRATRRSPPPTMMSDQAIVEAYLEAVLLLDTSHTDIEISSKDAMDLETGWIKPSQNRLVTRKLFKTMTSDDYVDDYEVEGIPTFVRDATADKYVPDGLQIVASRSVRERLRTQGNWQVFKHRSEIKSSKIYRDIGALTSTVAIPSGLKLDRGTLTIPIHILLAYQGQARKVKPMQVQSAVVRLLCRTNSRGGADTKPTQTIDTIKEQAFLLSTSLMPGAATHHEISIDLGVPLEERQPDTTPSLLAKQTPTFRMPNIERDYLLTVSVRCEYHTHQALRRPIQLLAGAINDPPTFADSVDYQLPSSSRLEELPSYEVVSYANIERYYVSNFFVRPAWLSSRDVDTRLTTSGRGRVGGVLFEHRGMMRSRVEPA